MTAPTSLPRVLYYGKQSRYVHRQKCGKLSLHKPQNIRKLWVSWWLEDPALRERLIPHECLPQAIKDLWHAARRQARAKTRA